MNLQPISFQKMYNNIWLESLLRQMGLHCQKSIRSEIFKYRGIDPISASFAAGRKSNLV